jgi:hypothetical protein
MNYHVVIADSRLFLDAHEMLILLEQTRDEEETLLKLVGQQSTRARPNIPGGFYVNPRFFATDGDDKRWVFHLISTYDGYIQSPHSIDQ